MIMLKRPNHRFEGKEAKDSFGYTASIGYDGMKFSCQELGNSTYAYTLCSFTAFKISV